MTTFEGIMCLAATTAIIILGIGMYGIAQKLKEIVDRQYANWEQLRKIETHANFLPDISRQLDNIEDNILDDLRDIRLAQELSKPLSNVLPPPCFAPNGICMNPHGDCINCPKRGDGGTWTTSTNTIKED